MKITESKRNGIAVLTVAGRVDASNAGMLEETLLERVAAGEKVLVVDCAGLDYISSAGLRALLVAAKRLMPSNGQIALAALKEHIKEVFDIAGLSSIFSLHATVEEALAGRR